MKEAIFAIIKVSVIVVIVFVLGCGGGSDDEDGGANVVPVQVNNADGVGALHIEVVYDSSIVEVPATDTTSIRLQPRAYIFPAIYDLIDYDDAKQIMRLNVTVWNSTDLIFSKQMYSPIMYLDLHCYENGILIQIS